MTYKSLNKKKALNRKFYWRNYRLIRMYKGKSFFNNRHQDGQHKQDVRKAIERGSKKSKKEPIC
jgi:hypothetical protein